MNSSQRAEPKPARAHKSEAVSEEPEDAPRLSSAESCYEQIKRQIITNVLQPGESIDERRLAEMLGVSRTPVREALLRLKTEGFIDIMPRRGAVIRSISIAELGNLYEVVTALEVMVAGLIAERGASKVEIAALEQACKDMSEAAEAEDHEAWTRADEKFHQLLLDFSLNPALKKAGIFYRELSQRAHFVADRARPPGTEKISIANHKALVKLIKAGDADGARANHLEQRNTGSQKLLDAIVRLGLRALDYMGLTPGTQLAGIKIDRAFIGSCTNGRIEDLQAAANVLKGKKIALDVMAIVVSGSQAVRARAEEEGLDRIFTEAGFEWRNSGCSMCLAMNDDMLAPGERCASSTNRNFEGRQGRNGRRHLMSPAMVAAAAVAGAICDFRTLGSE